ncbi:hypothetical protein LTR94_032017, partial [Friedmanniomyces endolithicus]
HRHGRRARLAGGADARAVRHGRHGAEPAPPRLEPRLATRGGRAGVPPPGRVGAGRAGKRRRHRHVFRARHAKPDQPAGNGLARARRKADRAGPRGLLAQGQRRHHRPRLWRASGADHGRTDRRRPPCPDRSRREEPFRAL